MMVLEGCWHTHWKVTVWTTGPLLYLCHIPQLCKFKFSNLHFINALITHCFWWYFGVIYTSFKQTFWDRCWCGQMEWEHFYPSTTVCRFAKMRVCLVVCVCALHNHVLFSYCFIFTGLCNTFRKTNTRIPWSILRMPTIIPSSPRALAPSCEHRPLLTCLAI